MIVLYRGDSLPQGPSTRANTILEDCISAGMFAKFIDGGSSTLLTGKNLAQMVIEHVGYEKDTAAEKFSKRSPLISFSECKATARRFMDRKRKGKGKFEETTIDSATHFFWTLTLPDILVEHPTGVYDCLYEGDSVNVTASLPDLTPTGIEADPILLANHISQRLMNNTPHQAKVVDVVRYLAKRCSLFSTGVKSAKVRSQRDKEWLVYPCTPMPDGRGVSARFQMNKHLKLKLLRKVS